MIKKLWNDQAFRYSLLASAIWSLAAHAYAFLHSSFSHDALNAIYASSVEERWKVELGRFIFPIYRSVLRGQLLLPWVIGILFTLWVLLTVYFICKLFDVKFFSPILMIAGVLAVNKTVIALTATYLYELDIDMLSVFFAVLAVYLWEKRKWGFLTGAICLAMTLGIYQCNLSVAVLLIIFVCILDLLLSRKTWQKVLIHGLLGIAMILLGGLLYALILKVALSIAGTQLVTGLYNSLPNMFLPGKDYGLLLLNAYADMDQQLQTVYGFYGAWFVTVVRLALYVLSICLMIRMIVVKKPKALAVILAVVLLILIPLGANFSYILNDGQTHDLMRFAFWLVTLWPVLLLESRPERRKEKSVSAGATGAGKRNHAARLAKESSQLVRSLAFVLLFVLLLNNVVTANAVYLKKDFEDRQTMSLMTRVMADLEDAMEDADASVTATSETEKPTVCFIGVPPFEEMPGFWRYSSLTGAYAKSPISSDVSTYYFNLYKAYVQYYLNAPLTLCADEVHDSFKASPAVAAMPSYPSAGYIQFIGGIWVVKIGE